MGERTARVRTLYSGVSINDVPTPVYLSWLLYVFQIFILLPIYLTHMIPYNTFEHINKNSLWISITGCSHSHYITIHPFFDQYPFVEKVIILSLCFFFDSTSHIDTYVHKQIDLRSPLCRTALLCLGRKYSLSILPVPTPSNNYKRSIVET